MPAYSRSDVYVTEQLLQSAPSFFPASSTAAFVGYTRQGPIVPTLVDSWSAFQRLYGGWVGTVDDSLAIQVYQFFNNGGRLAYIVRVLGAGSAIATLTLQDRQGTPANILAVNADNAGTWGNGVFIEIVDTGVTGRFNLNVRLGAATNAPTERFTDLSMNPVDPRNAVAMINSSSTGSNYVTVATPGGWTYASGTGIPIASVTPGGTALSGGADSSAQPTTGASGQLMTGLGLLGIVTTGMIINMVGVTDSTTINAAIAFVAARADSFLIIDPAFGQTSAQIVTTKASFTQSSFAATWWPNLYVGDPSSSTPGATRLIAPSGSVMGQIANTDATRGTHKAPAGVQTNLSNVLGLETPAPAASDYDAVAVGHVNGIRYYQQYGYVLWGSYTLKSTQADQEISIRRTLIAIEAALQQVTLFAVFEVNDQNLWYQVNSACTSVLQQLYQDGGLRGNNPSDAFFVTCDATNNTAQTIAAGEVHVTVGVSLQYPAHFIIINVGQYSGGSAVLETLS